MSSPSLKVMVLAGGPDRERAVSLQSGQAVTHALQQAGHDTQQRDIGPDDLSALADWQRWGAHAIFPVLHGRWGEGGELQQRLDERAIPYVGSTHAAARLCMDKHQTKHALAEFGLPTPAFALFAPGQPLPMTPPLVFKPCLEGSSIDVMICHNVAQARSGAARFADYGGPVLIERFIQGKELTLAVIETDGVAQALPPIEIVPPAGFYDYQAKYQRDDTGYLVGDDQIELPQPVLTRLRQAAVSAHQRLGCRHMSRVDFMVDASHQFWILEVNTIPGFTNHSLLPMAAAAHGWPLPRLVDRLVRSAVDPVDSRGGHS